ncbi:hypothetical protein MKZ38_008114 [Zalerion maritima]|uniref:PLD phosphodiesterase domain-containing protein n=1 Tax=Zalerion maritima TaxID=339359 RepID=A0AAD5WWA4_9PEZI|nr:hypothetical protein MKZ38_008114 [Zalerion maritima]
MASAGLAYEPFVERWKHALVSASDARDRKSDFPSYFFDGPDAIGRGLVTTCVPHDFRVGTGANLYTATILPALLAAEREVVLVTCFWAPSRTLDALGRTIEELAKRRKARIAAGNTVGSSNINGSGSGEARGGGSKEPQKLRLRIGLSSVSLFQRLFHTSKKEGYVYPPSKWARLGLPDAKTLGEAGIEMQVKSLFFNPISVLHPKFVVVDGTVAFLPSANVSWEPWLEGCVTVTGDVVGRLLRFYREVWEFGREGEGGVLAANTVEWDQPAAESQFVSAGLPVVENPSMPAEHARVPLSQPRDGPSSPIATILLPSPHHRNPRFRPFPWQKSPDPPATPLNAAIQCLLAGAQRDVYLQSPNFTCPAVLGGIIAALDRGVDVRIVAGGKKMMLLEQIVTAGTTTGRCLKKLVARYQKMARGPGRDPNVPGPANGMLDVEQRIRPLGNLIVSYFCPPKRRLAGGEERTDGGRMVEEPTHAHLKLTVVDGSITVLGSGNMDRASFFTSQELGMLFRGEEIAAGVMEVVDKALEGRLEKSFSSVIVGS